jgi:hypothetical protein
METRTDSDLSAMLWQPQPVAAAAVREILATVGNGCNEIRRFADQLCRQTGTRLIDWVDHVALPAGEQWEARLAQAGFSPREQGRYVMWEHARGLFPQIFTDPNGTWQLAVRVESVDDFLAAHSLEGTPIEGEQHAPLRRARVAAETDFEFWVIERHGYRGREPVEFASDQSAAIRAHGEAFAQRRRPVEDAELGFAEAHDLIRAAVADLGTGRASDLFFAAERDYWTRRNPAGGFQKARQDSLGLGWANHDHHTYRSSRGHFSRLVALLEDLGMVCRERFYAGREAGWGAQVLEQEESQVVVFADVDLSPDELSDDFAHAPLPARKQFGTVGLWCLLHGEAFLAPGMHHLECRFDVAAVRAQLEQAGVCVMKPFTDLSYLKQAFTEAEKWPVAPARIEAAVAAGAITHQQAEQFRRDGVLGSHLEILQRDEGYKGFNQTGINDIIRATDPRRENGI